MLRIFFSLLVRHHSPVNDISCVGCSALLSLFGILSLDWNFCPLGIVLGIFGKL